MFKWLWTSVSGLKSNFAFCGNQRKGLSLLDTNFLSLTRLLILISWEDIVKIVKIVFVQASEQLLDNCIDIKQLAIDAIPSHCGPASVTVFLSSTVSTSAWLGGLGAFFALWNAIYGTSLICEICPTPLAPEILSTTSKFELRRVVGKSNHNQSKEPVGFCPPFPGSVLGSAWRGAYFEDRTQ